MANVEPDPQALPDDRPNEDSGLLFSLMVLLPLTVVAVLTAEATSGVGPSRRDGPDR